MASLDLQLDPAMSPPTAKRRREHPHHRTGSFHSLYSTPSTFASNPPQLHSPPQLPLVSPPQKTYLIIGASTTLGLAFTSHLLRANHRVLATACGAQGASQLWSLTGSANGRNLTIWECDFMDWESVGRFVGGLRGRGRNGRRGDGECGRGGLQYLDCVVVNIGVLEYPGGIMEITYPQFQNLLQANTIGPLLVARSLLGLSFPSATSQSVLPIHTLAFISSDSGSAGTFRAFEDGFGGFAVSKAGLNQGIRHLAAESARLNLPTKILALHPGEVQTDMMSASATGFEEVEGIISPDESVAGLLRVLDERGYWGEDGELGLVGMKDKDEDGEREGKRKGKGKMEMGIGHGRGNGEAEFWTWEGKRYPW